MGMTVSASGKDEPSRVVEVPTHPALLSDENLIRLVGQHDRDAFLALYDRYAARMMGLILKVVRDRHGAEDVLQKTMLEVWNKHAARYQPVLGSVEGWLLRLARSRAVDQARASSRRPTLGMDEVSESSFSSGLVGVTWSDEAFGDAEKATLAHAVNSLPEEERRPIVMAYLHGLSREQIAEACGVPVGTVKTRIRRGVYRLREQLSEVGAISP